MYSTSEMNSSNSTGGMTPDDLKTLCAYSATMVGYISFSIMRYMQNQTNSCYATNTENQSGQYSNLLNRKKELLTQINDYEDCVNTLAEEQLTSTIGDAELKNIGELKVKLSENYDQLAELNNALQTELDNETIMPEHDLDNISETIISIERLQKENECLKLVSIDIRKSQDIKVAELEIQSKELRERMTNTFFSNPTNSSNNLDNDKRELKL